MLNKTLKELYEEIEVPANPQMAFIRYVSELTHKSELTVRLWIKGTHKPDALTIKVLAEALNVDPDTLFSHVQNTE